MKYLKLVCLAVAATALLTGTASATTLTSPANTTYTGAVKLVSEGQMTLHNEFLAPFNCSWSLEGKTESHGAAVTAGGKVVAITMTNCTSTQSISVLNPGSLQFHTDTESADGNGDFTLVGFELSLFYPAVGLTCKYGTGTGISLGTLTGSKTTKSNATVDGSSPQIPVVGSSIFCGKFGTLTGSFQVSTPTYLDVD